MTDEAKPAKKRQTVKLDRNRKKPFARLTIPPSDRPTVIDVHIPPQRKRPVTALTPEGTDVGRHESLDEGGV